MAKTSRQTRHRRSLSPAVLIDIRNGRRVWLPAPEALARVAQRAAWIEHAVRTGRIVGYYSDRRSVE